MGDEPSDLTWVERLRKWTGNHEESTVAVAEGLVIELPDLIQRLATAIEADSAKDTQRLGHTLKSSLRYITDGPELDMASALEICGKESRTEDAGALLTELRQPVDAWVNRIQHWLDAS